MGMKEMVMLAVAVFGNGLLACQKVLPEPNMEFRSPAQVEWSPQSVILNELLFNPPAAGVDYVEIRHVGRDPIQLNGLFLASLNEDGSVNKQYALGERSSMIYPNEYRVFTVNKKWLCSYYECDSNAVIQLKTMPVMNNTAGRIALLDQQGNILDELEYSEKMHFSYLPDWKGVALERISHRLVSNWTGTWHSASYSSRFGTPTRTNSQDVELIPGMRYGFFFNTTRLSPNCDGVEDILRIEYAFPQPGFVAHLDVYRADGIQEAKLWDGILLGTVGQVEWDGCLQGRRLPVADYIFSIRYFNLKGESCQVKKEIRIQW